MIAMNDAVLKLEAVCKAYMEPHRRLQVLDSLSFSARAGEVVLVEGPSGSGKTTLLQIMGALLRADSGSILLAGTEVNAAPAATRTEARRRNLGFVFQHFHLLDALDVYDNVALGLRFKRQPIEARKVQHVLELLGIAAKASKLPRDSSGGEKQRVAFARALVGDPVLLLADEPTSQLDGQAAGSVADMIRSAFNNTEAAAIIATHDTRLHPVATRICKLSEGRIHEQSL